MSKQYYYTIFKVRWGFFGICGTENGIIKTCLPVKTKRICRILLTKGIDNVVFDNTFMSSLKHSISSYYKGTYVRFKEVVCLTGLSPFSRKVLLACMKVNYGQTITYKSLAKLAGHPKAIRSVGAVMARNPIPLIIPCHRVLASDGSLHGFSAPGGMKTKKKMLQLEKQLV